MIRFIGHKNSVAMIIEEIKINKNEAEDNENIYGTIRCSICHSLVIVETFYPDNYEKIYF